MKISCEQAAEICNKSQYREASLIEIIKLKYHIFICKTCKQFTTKNTKLTKLCNESKLQMLSEEEKAKMKAELGKPDN